MGLLTDYFAATPEQAAACLEHGPLGTELPHAELKNVDPSIVLGKLWAYAVGAEYSLEEFDADGGTHVLDAENVPVVIRVKESCTTALASIDEGRVLPLAAQWSESEEWPGKPDPSQLAEVVRQLSRVAQAATAPGIFLYVWYCL